MAISFDPEKHLFTLANAFFSYAFVVNDLGSLQHLYYGEPLAEIDPQAMSADESELRYCEKDGIEKTVSCLYSHYSEALSMMELPPFGGLDKREAPLLVVPANSSTLYCRFLYQSHRISKGFTTYQSSLPLAKGNPEEAETLEIVLKEASSGIYVTLHYTVLAQVSVLLRSLTIENRSQQDYRLLRAYSFSLDLPDADYDLSHFHGEWCKERQWEKEKIGDGMKRIANESGSFSNLEAPFFLLSRKGTDEKQGEAIGISYVYSGNFAFDAIKQDYGTLRIEGGISDEHFSALLKPGESFETPQVVLAYSSKGYGSLSRNLADFVRENIQHDLPIEAPHEVHLCSWDGAFFDFDTKRIIEMIDAASKVGVNLFLLDDGWFGRRNDDTSSLGDWKVNTAKIDLHQAIARAREKNLKFGIWLEPEMINPNSELYRAHHDWVLGQGATPFLSLSRHQLVLDMANPAVVDAVFKEVSALFEEYSFDEVKFDFNRPLSEAISPSLPAEKKGETYYRYQLGMYSFYSRFHARFPKVEVQMCASGGARMDYSTLSCAFFHQGSDTNDAIERMRILYDTSLFFPLATIGSNVFALPIVDAYSRGAVALFGYFGYEIDPTKLTKDDEVAYGRINDIYRRYYLDCIQNGDLYRLLSPHEGNQFLVISVSKKKNQAIALFVSLMRENPHRRYLKFEGLDPTKFYTNSCDQRVHSGAYYAKVGLALGGWLNEFTVKLITFDEAKA